MDDEPWQRTLEHLTGVQGLNKSEVRKDVKEVEQLLEDQRQYVEKHQNDKSKAPTSSNPADDEDVALSKRRRQQHLANLYLNKSMPKKKRSRGREVMSAEEIIETLPACRRAVRLTQAELAAVKKERLNLEDTYLKLRSSFIHELEALVREDKDQQRVMLRIRKSVGKAAAKLLSSKRRHTALQDILVELESRGDTIESLQTQVARLTKLLGQHDIPLDSVVVGDTVSWADGKGEVVSVTKDEVQVKLESGETAAVAADAVEVEKASVTSGFTEDELAMKAKYFEKAGEWVSAEVAWKELVEKEELEEDDWDSDDEDDDEVDEDVDKKADKKADKLKKLIPFKATTLPSTPYDVPLLVSPLSELPDHVAAAAAGVSNVQWMGSALPENLVQWEAERMESLAMKGEIERLKFQLQQAEAQKKDAQNHVNVQLESINKLVSQLEKQREAAAAVATSVSQAPPKDVKPKKPTAPAADKRPKQPRKDSMSESASTPGSPLKDVDMSGGEEDTADDDDKGVETTRRSLRSSKTPVVAPSPAKPTAAPDDKGASTAASATSSSANNSRRKKDSNESAKKDETEVATEKTNGAAKPATRRKSSRAKGTPKSPTNADNVSDTEDEPAAKRRTRA